MELRTKMKGNVRSVHFAVREDNTLAVELKLKGGTRTVVFRDSIQKGGKRWFLFHAKTLITVSGNTVSVRTAAVQQETGAPIPGLLITYRFCFDNCEAAFYLSTDFSSDVRCSGYTLKLLDVFTEGLTPHSFTGYEYDAMGKPFSHTFTIPSQNGGLDYETRMKMDPHVAWEQMKIRPHTFKKAVALHGDDGYLAVSGGTPTYHVEGSFLTVFTNMDRYDADLRFFSGKNSPGAWFLLEKPQDFFQTIDALEQRIPALAEHALAPFVERIVPVESGELKMQLLQTRSGVWVDAVYARKETACQPLPFFTIDLWDTRYNRELLTDSGNSWDRVEILQSKNYIRVTLSDPDSGNISGISVVAEGYSEPKNHRVSWKMRVVNRSDRWSVIKLSYPQCLAQGFVTAYATVCSGTVYDRFNQRTETVRLKYPTGWRTSMAYVAMYDPVSMEDVAGACNGIYMGIHDPSGTPKFMYMAGAPQSECTLLSGECVLPYGRNPGNSYTLPGYMVWQRFRGDWFDATNIYRAFVLTQAQWLPQLRGRPDSPEWFRNNPVWIMHFMPNENPDANPFPITLREQNPDRDPADWYRTAVRFRQEIGVPVSYHLYNWHWVPFNNDNPHYFPAHHDLKAGMQALKAAGIRVIPYMAGYSWDMCDRRGGDYRFMNEAYPATAKDPEGNPIHTRYASTEPTGQPVRFARMCPTTAMWKNEVRQVVRRLYSDFKADGIYLDVVSTSYEPCYDDTHLHAPGYGDYWWKAYSELIAGLRADAPEDFAVVSECTSEVYAGALDGFLSWTWVNPDLVPAFPQVYGGRVAVFGRVITQNKRNDTDYFRFQVAQSFVYGQQLGWVHPEIVNDKAQFPFLKKLANLRWQHRDFFAEAEMLRPPLLSGDVPLLNCEPFLRCQIWNHEQLVQAGSWKDGQGKRKLFVINAAGVEADVTLAVYENEYDLPENITGFDFQDGFVLCDMHSENGVRYFRCRIASEGVGILTW